MNPITVTFVGGPEAGRRMRMEHNRDYQRFALCPRIPAAPLDYASPHEAIYMEQFTYRIERLPGDVFVGVPNEWYDDKYSKQTWLERTVAELTRGYTGRV